MPDLLDGGIQDICLALVFHTIYWQRKRIEVSYYRMILEGLEDNDTKAGQAYNAIIEDIYGQTRRGQLSTEKVQEIMEEESKKAILVQPVPFGLSLRKGRKRK